MGNFHLAVDGAHLIDGLDLRRKPTVNAKDLAIDECPKRQVIERLIEVFPRCGASIFLDDLIVESVNSSNLPGFVVTPQQQYLFGVFDLIAEEQLDSLDRVVPPIHEVTNKDVSVLRQLPSYLEQLKHVEELSVDIPADGDGCLRFLYV